MKKKHARVKLALRKKTVLPLAAVQASRLRGGGASEVDPFTCLSQVKCSNSKNLYSCTC